MKDQVLVTIGDDPVEEREGDFADDSGKTVSYHTFKQPAKLESGGYAYPAKINLEKDRKPYAPGVYVMRTDKMVRVDQNGKLSFLKYPVLEPVPAANKP